MQLCNLTKVHRITRVVHHRVTCTVLHHVFFFPTFVFFILVFFELLKPVALSLFVTVLLLYTVFFAFACFYFIQKLVPPMSLLQSCVASVFKHYIPRCSYTYPECISFVAFFPSASPSPHCQMCTLFVCFFFFFLPEFSG